MGHEAYSCDLIPTSGDHPEYHIQKDVLTILNDGWDMMIAHPPCTQLCVSGQRWFNDEKYFLGTPGYKPHCLKDDAINFVKLLINAPIEKIAIENPISIISSRIRKPDQVIRPFCFGDDSSKSTCLWLKNLPKLKPTNIITSTKIITKSGRSWDKWFFETSCISDKKLRSKIRSKTFQGIANAMANQWGMSI
jgi:hypothetical protein